MMNGEFNQFHPDGELERLQNAGFKRLASSNFVAGGGLLIEKHEGRQRLYAPYRRIDSERVEAIRLYTTVESEKLRLRVQVLQRSTPERTAMGGNEKEYLDVTPEGYGGPVRDDEATTRARLTALSELSIVEQLEQSDFVVESVTDDISILRFSQSHREEVVAVVTENRLSGLFTSSDREDRSGGVIDHSKLEIMGVAEIPGLFDDDPRGIGVRVSNGWAEFTIDPNTPSWPQEPRIVREPTLEELNIPAIPEKVEPSGFVQGGVNETETIRQLDAINGVPVNTLNADMQPGAWSQAGFLGQGENIIDIMARDNDIVRGHGLTHQELALPLRYIQRLYQLGMLRDTSLSSPPGVNEITIGGHPYKIDAVAWRGYQESPFRDDTRSSYDLKVLSLETGHAFSASALISEMVARYGFYEGMGTSYRVAPETIINTFSHLRREQDVNADPVFALTSSQATSVALTNADQVTRFRRLHKAGVPTVTEADVTIRFSSTTDLLTFLNNEANASLLNYLDTDSINALEPSQLKLEGYSSVRRFAEVLGQLEEETQRTVINLISGIDTSEQQSFMRGATLEEVLEASIKDIDGSLVRQPAAGLLEKLDYTPADFLAAFYRSAGGRYSEWVERKAEEPHGTRHREIELNEDRTRALTAVFGEHILPLVEPFREAMRIDATQPPEEQVVAFLKKHHLLEKAQAIAGHFLAKKNRPDLELPDWVRISEVVDGLSVGMQSEDVNEDDKQFLASRNMSLNDLLDARRLYPVGTPDTVVLQLYNGALERYRR